MHDDFIPRRAEEPSPLGNGILSEKIQFLIQKKETGFSFSFFSENKFWQTRKQCHHSKECEVNSYDAFSSSKYIPQDQKSLFYYWGWLDQPNDVIRLFHKSCALAEEKTLSPIIFVFLSLSFKVSTSELKWMGIT